MTGAPTQADREAQRRQEQEPKRVTLAVPVRAEVPVGDVVRSLVAIKVAGPTDAERAARAGVVPAMDSFMNIPGFAAMARREDSELLRARQAMG